MKSPYFSFLLCSHKEGAEIHVYINGMPLGIVRAGIFESHGFAYPKGEPVLIRLHNLPESFPFETLDEMKKMLKDAIDKLEVIEEKPDEN